jgi:hypothetical protein
MVTERQEEPQKSVRKAQNLQQQKAYGVRRIFEGYSRIVSASVGRSIDGSYETGLSTLRGLFRADSVPISLRSEWAPNIFEMFEARGRALSGE